MLEFWLKSDKAEFRFPVNPPSVKVTKGYKHNEFTVMGLGEITFPQSPELARFSFSSFFPAEYNPTYCEYSGFSAPFTCVSIIETMMNAGKPVRFTVSGCPINTLVTIRSFNFDPWDQRDNDIPFTIELAEYRPPKITRTVVTSGPTTPTTETAPTKGLINVGRGKQTVVRKTASSKAGSAGKLAHGTTVFIVKVLPGWFQVDCAKPKLTGYVEQTKVQVTERAAAKATVNTVTDARPVETRDKGVTEDA